MIGQDFKKISGNSRQIISGLDKTDINLFFSGTRSSIANQNASILCDFYTHLDMVLVIIDGQMVGHW